MNNTQYSAINAIQDFIRYATQAKKDFFNGKVDAIVTGNETYLFRNISLFIGYETAYMQYKISILWEEDNSQPSYKELKLHGSYNTNFQNDISYKDGTLSFYDGDNKILIKLKS